MKKILFIDADNVLYKTVDVFCAQYSVLSKAELKKEDVTRFDLYGLCEHPIYVDIILKNPKFFENIPLKGNNTIEMIIELNKIYQLYIITSAFLSAIPGKVNAFIRDFPFLRNDQIIFMFDKTLLKGDIIVDDALHNLQGFKSTNKKGVSICVNMPYNKGINDEINYRIDTLEELGMYLL